MEDQGAERFGSILGEDFRPDSDVDLLLTFKSDEACETFDTFEAEDDISRTLNRRVDLVTKDR